MYWTKQKPKDEGWYWMRRPDPFKKNEFEDSIEYVRNYAGKMCIINWEISDNCLWAGPIPHPIMINTN